MDLFREPEAEKIALAVRQYALCLVGPVWSGVLRVIKTW